MKHYTAITLMKKRIELLNKEILKSEKIMEEPEMLSDIEYARIDCVNMETEINSLLDSIHSLINLGKPIKIRKESFSYFTLINENEPKYEALGHELHITHLFINKGELLDYLEKI